MMQTKTTLAAAVIAAIILLGALVVGINWHKLSEWYTWQATEPDMQTQQAVANVSVRQVASIELGMIPPVIVERRQAVCTLLQGLKEARIPKQRLQNRAYEVKIKLKSGKILGPFLFGGDHEIDAFSPEFVHGLRMAGVKVPKQ